MALNIWIQMELWAELGLIPCGQGQDSNAALRKSKRGNSLESWL